MTKKIAVVIANLATPGGAEKVAADLINEFSRCGYEVTLITFEATQQVVLQPEAKQHIHLPLPSQSGGLFTQINLLLKRAWAFRKLFKQHQFDHIFSFLEAANVPCALASRQSVLSMHLDPKVMTSKEWFLVKYLYPRVRAVIAVSRNMRSLLKQRAGLKNLHCIYNPIDTQTIKQKAQEQPEIAINEPFIVAVGRLTQQKRFDRLLEAYAQSDIAEKVRLVIVGSGEKQAELEQKVEALGLQQRVTLTGYQSNPYAYMQSALFLVMSSDHEGYPLTLLEALALSCPLVSVDCPTGPREIIQHEYNGLLVPHQDTQALAQAIWCLANDTALYEGLKANTKQSVQANDIKVVAQRWLAI